MTKEETLKRICKKAISHWMCEPVNSSMITFFVEGAKAERNQVLNEVIEFTRNHSFEHNKTPLIDLEHLVEELQKMKV